MTSRRLFIGNAGSGVFKFRQSMAGYDALSAPLDHTIFDADYIPGKILGSGTGLAERCTTHAQSNPLAGGTGVQYVAAHSFGKAPDMLLIIGRPIDHASGNTTTWSAWGATGGGGPVGFGLANSFMDHQYCTPFIHQQFLYVKPVGGTPGYYTGAITFGWQAYADATNIVVDNFCNHRIGLQWVGLEI